jgi:hypothetical protein
VSSPAQFLWIGGKLSVLEQLALRSFLAHGYDVHLYTYQEVENVPAGVIRMPGAEILPADRIFTVTQGWGAGSYANFADLFRYHLLRKRGGWWFDIDFVSIKRLPTPENLYFASSFEGASGVLSNCCAIHAQPGHPVIERLCTEAEEELRREPDVGFGQIGPYMVQRLVRELKLEENVAPWWEFSPYPQGQISRLVYSSTGEWLAEQLRFAKFLVRQLRDPGFKAGYLRRQTRALHLHNELWREAKRDKNARYHPRCLFERLKRRHGL